MKLNHLMKSILLALAALYITTPCYGDQVVIVHPSNDATISEKDISRLYLAKMKSFPGGTLAIPLNHKDSSEARTNFDTKVIGKSPSQMKSYWAKLVFTGKATPLTQVTSDDEVIELVSVNPGAIGYIDKSKVNSKVKIIHSL